MGCPNSGKYCTCISTSILLENSFSYVQVLIYRDAYLCKLGTRGIPISDEDNKPGDDEMVMAVEDAPEAAENNEIELTEEQMLMKSMGLPVAFTSDMLRIEDSDDDTQVLYQPVSIRQLL